jgi:hypothetical protein
MLSLQQIVSQLVCESKAVSEAHLDFVELAKVRPTWVIEALQALGSTDVVTAEKGMRCFEEDPYYSDELSNVTAPDVPFLLELLKPERPMCRQLTMLLGSLVALAPRADGETPTQRFQELDPRLHRTRKLQSRRPPPFAKGELCSSHCFTPKTRPCVLP